jgi:hypothetical protein
MIVVYKETGWKITTQRSHGILAAQIGMHWKNFPLPERWLETLMAIGEHDDAENELDGENLLTENGGPLNYSMKTFDLAHCEKLVIHAVAKSQFMYLLTSLHMEFLYRPEAKKNKTARHFLAVQKKEREYICKKLGISKTNAGKVYSLLQWCDAFSLLLCQRDLPPENRKIEISTGPDSTRYELSRLKNNILTVDPWPFQSKSFSVYFEYRTIKKMKFANSADLRNEFIAAPTQEIVYEISKRPRRQVT